MQKELAQERNKRRRSEKEDPEFKKGKKPKQGKGKYIKRFKGKRELQPDAIGAVFDIENVQMLASYPHSFNFRWISSRR